MTDPAIRFQDVSKRFKLYHERHYSLKENVLTMFRNRRRWEEFWALKAIDLDVPRGQMLGIIGENGSGKSTCLKLLARILTPDTGSVAVRGSVSALIELGAGFQPDFTGRENVYLNGSILGFTRKEIDARFDDIVGFAELERFIDTPVKNYSSGMYMRLGFSIATHVNPDILLIDEILAVGDEAFQQKCLERIQSFRESGKTIVFVSHALGAVESLCDRAVLLSQGRLVADGPPAETVECYRRVLGMATHAQVPAPQPDPMIAQPAGGHDEGSTEQLRMMHEQLQRLEQRIGTPISVENAFQRIQQLEASMGIVHHQEGGREQALRDLGERQRVLEQRISAVHHGHPADDEGGPEHGPVRAPPDSEEWVDLTSRFEALLEKVAWIERRVSAPISIENARERIVQLEDAMGITQQQGSIRDQALGDLSSRLIQLESRIATFFSEGVSVVPRQHGTRDVEIVDVGFFTEKGEPSRRFRSGEPCIVRIAYRVNTPVENPVFGIAFIDQRGAVAFGTNTAIDGIATAQLESCGSVELKLTRLALLAGLFYVTVAVHSPDHAVQHHRLDNCYSIVVEARKEYDGRVDMDCSWCFTVTEERGTT